MLKPTKHSLKKLELLLEEIGYIVRYEKGNFQSGYCVVKDRKIAIVNKFYDTEARVNTLIDIVETIEFEEGILSEKSLKTLKTIQEAADVKTEEAS